MRKVRETQRKRNKKFLEALLNQELIPNFRPKSPCKCPYFAKLADKHKAANSDSSQDRQAATNDNIPTTVRKMQVQVQKWPRKQQTHRKVSLRSDWSDSDDAKHNQARGKPVAVDITSDHEMDADQQPSTSIPNNSTP